MRRRLALLALSFAVLLSPIWGGRAAADGNFGLRLVGAAGHDAREARFDLVNQSSEAISFTTYDGGTVHNGIERLDSGTWTDVSLGYCGLGMDGETTVAAGRRAVLRAYLPEGTGTFRIRVHVTRMTPAGPVPEEIVSTPFQRR